MPGAVARSFDRDEDGVGIEADVADQRLTISWLSGWSDGKKDRFADAPADGDGGGRGLPLRRAGEKES